ncbi:hypothetical protein OHB44_27885 [Micromonospora sp. NBC_00821]|uniref:hypothetical protein n=1 Tax=Micromonospora sp. NBC_00821 TaxID=2975977 RepID=UPI002ED58D96|nr:hypothetical protein OHB44_27885 [Micromonospora sp. NBC_00821]
MTADLEAIRTLVNRHVSAIGPGGDKAWTAGLLAAKVPALCDEVQQLRAELDRERQAHVCIERCAPNSHVAFQGRQRVTHLESMLAAFQPVAFPDGSQVFVHECRHTEWWNEQEHGPINDQGCDACDSAPFSGGWQLVYVRKAAGR